MSSRLGLRRSAAVGAPIDPTQEANRWKLAALSCPLRAAYRDL